ncbi:MAG: hypothetical protein HC805_08330 [Alkalinema sp. RL_2_19]|nr:hypothetical protein [Alkalinema sp. RL_2_19]
MPALIELPQIPIGPEPSSPALSICLIISFALLGLALPDHEPKLKPLHLIASFGILIIGVLIAKIRLIALLYVVLVVRAAFIFQTSARIAITICTFLLAIIYQVDRIQAFQVRQAQQAVMRSIDPTRPRIRRPLDRRPTDGILGDRAPSEVGRSPRGFRRKNE